MSDEIDIHIPWEQRHEVLKLKTGTRYRLIIQRPVLGFVHLQLLSSLGHPFRRIACTLYGSGYKVQQPEKKTNDDGVVCWNNLPIKGYELKISLGVADITFDVPWLASKNTVHVQRLACDIGLLTNAGNTYAVQTRLIGLGYDCGQADGERNDKTEEQLRCFAEDRALAIDGDDLTGALRALTYEFGA